MTHLIRELADPSRRAILSELLGGSRSVTELVNATNLKQPNVSNHLAKLRDRGILRSQKNGRQVMYALANGQLEAVLHAYLARRTDAAAELDDAPAAVDAYVKAAVHGDEETCASLVQGALEAGYPMLAIYDELLSPAMFAVGELYIEGAIDEAHEHMASVITEAMMARVRQFEGRPAPGVHKALLGCVAGNEHVIGIEMIHDVLRSAGWSTVLLGANVPTRAFVRAVQTHEPDLVLLSMATRDQLANALELVRELAPLRTTGVTIGVGGKCVEDFRTELLAAGADFVSNGIRDFSENQLPSLAD